MVVIFQVTVFWVLMPCTALVGYHCFRGPSCPHLQGKVGRMGKNSTDTGLDWRGAAGAISLYKVQREWSGNQCY